MAVCGGFGPFEALAGRMIYMIYEIHLKEGHVSLKRILKISTHFEIPVDFSFTFFVSGTRLILGVEDCKDPKFLKNLKFYLLLFYYYFGLTGKKCEKLRGCPKFFV